MRLLCMRANFEVEFAEELQVLSDISGIGISFLCLHSCLFLLEAPSKSCEKWNWIIRDAEALP